MLWHAGSCWIVGNRSDLGSKIGGLLAYDGALRPEAAQHVRRYGQGVFAIEELLEGLLEEVRQEGRAAGLQEAAT